MARFKNSIVECDVCGFEYRRNVMKTNSYGLMVCPRDYDGSYDLKNHAQNKQPVLREYFHIPNARPENNADRNQLWNGANTNWNATTKHWNTI